MFLAESEFNFKNKVVLLRIDSDVDLRTKNNSLVVDEDFRLRSALSTIRFLQEKKVRRIILLGHLGRPCGRLVTKLSLRPVADWFTANISQCQLVSFDDLKDLKNQPTSGFFLLENLRFNPGEEVNSRKFAGELSSLGDVYVNDAFGVAHRRHASIVGIPGRLPSFLGIRIEGEIQALSWLRKKASRPLVFVLGGSKMDKLDYLDFLSGWADKTLVGGKLPALIKNSKLKVISYKEKLILGRLKKSGQDIDGETTREFKKIIAKAKTVIWAGPMGVYEKKEFQRGSWQVAKAVAGSGGLRVAGGGDTHRILTKLKLWARMNYVSIGGGSMLEFLKKGDLPGIKAVRDLKK